MQELGQRYAGDKVEVVALRGKRADRGRTAIDRQARSLSASAVGNPAAADGDSSGVTVRYVYPQSPAARAGIVAGDVLLKVADKAVTGRDELLLQMAALEAGEETEIEFRHADQDRTVKVTLDRLPEGLPPAELPPAHPPIKPKKARSDKAKSDKTEADKAKSDKAKLDTAKTKPGKADKAKPGIAKPGNVKPAEVGVVWLAVPEAKHKVWAYVPDGYNAAVPHGLVIWLHGKAAVSRQELLARWKPLCDRYDLIVAAPRGDDATGWKADDAALVGNLIQQVGTTYHLDPTRVAVCGQESGGTLACAAGVPRPVAHLRRSRDRRRADGPTAREPADAPIGHVRGQRREVAARGRHHPAGRPVADQENPRHPQGPGQSAARTHQRRTRRTGPLDRHAGSNLTSSRCGKPQ